MRTSRAQVTRRTLLSSATALTALAGLGLPRRAEASPAMAVGAAFSFDILSDWARAQAAVPYVEPVRPEGFLGALDYDDYRSIRFRPERARWSDPGDQFRLHAFHTGWLFGEPVQMFDVSGGTVQPMPFTTADFAYDNGLSERVPADAPLPGVAGFRLHYPLNRPDILDELVAFLGASYFRALGQGSSYGLSARGLAINTAVGVPEEFPRFTAFYLERPAPGADHCVLSASLDSPSVTGAYRFVIRPGEDTRMEVTARLWFRADVEQVGIAPLTSMFLYDDKNRARFDDYRPRVHDSNGLRLIGADGENVGVVTPARALQTAEEAGLDLVEISPTAVPPACARMQSDSTVFSNSRTFPGQSCSSSGRIWAPDGIGKRVPWARLKRRTKWATSSGRSSRRSRSGGSWMPRTRSR